MTRTHCLAAALAALLLPAAAARAEEARGVLKDFDPAKKQLVIEPRGGRGVTASFMVSDNAAVTIGLRDGKLADLVPGKRVRLTYEIRDGKAIVTAIHVTDIVGTLQRLQALTAPPGPFAPPGPAAPPAAAPMPPAAGPPGGATVTGTLRRVAPTEREIILALPEAGREKYLALPVAADAPVTRDGKPIALADLKEEESATVRTATRDGKPTAVAIQVGRPPAGAAPAPAAPQAPAAAPAPPAESKINQVRRVLQMVDQLLEQFEKRPPQ